MKNTFDSYQEMFSQAYNKKLGSLFLNLISDFEHKLGSDRTRYFFKQSLKKNNYKDQFLKFNEMCCQELVRAELMSGYII